MLSASTRMRKMPSKQLRTSTTKISMDNASQFSSARRVESTIPLTIDALLAEMMTVEVALLAEMMALPRPAITATSLATLPESAASPAVIADQEADQTSKKIHFTSEINQSIGEEVDSVVAAVAVISEAEVAEEAAITAIADPDTAAADPEAPALLPDVMIAEDQEVAATEQARFAESSLIS